jgi:hypothetical protein
MSIIRNQLDTQCNNISESERFLSKRWLKKHLAAFFKNLFNHGDSVSGTQDHFSQFCPDLEPITSAADPNEVILLSLL